MPSLSAGFNLGTASASSLIKSAATLKREVATYEDDAAKIAYANSGHTDEAYQTYVRYLTGRIKTLSTSGSVTDLTKAENMQQEVVTATHSNISYNIQQENMRLMAQGDAGTVAGYQMKMQVVAGQFQRAMAIGDETLAFSLQNQYYSLSQSLQSAQASAASAAKTLATASSRYQGNVITALKDGLDTLTTAAQNSSLPEFNAVVKQWVKQNSDALNKLGVSIGTDSQPNYFDIVNAVQGAIYNHTVLEAKAMAPYNMPGAQDKLFEAQKLIDGTTKISTLGGDLTAQEIQQAAQDPSMFAYDSSTGRFSRTAQIGYHYQTDASGKSTLVPTYSGIVGAGARNKVFFLTPQQTETMTNLGLNFTANGQGTTGDGVRVQATNATPVWLKAAFGGDNAMTNMYTDNNGNLVFRGTATDGNGFSAYVLANDGTGKYGLLEQTAEGQIRNAGGNYGFSSAAAINNLTNLSMIAKSTLSSSQPTSPSLAANSSRYMTTMKLASAIQTTPLKVTQPSLSPVPELKAVNPQGSTMKAQNAASGNIIEPTTSPQTTTGAGLNTSGGGVAIPLGGL